MYTYTWRKYLPLIRLLLKKSATATQTVALNQTDFLKFSKSRKPALTFTIDIREGKYSVLKLPSIAAELLEILMEDPASRTFIRAGQYNLTLAKNYQLVITNLAAVENTPAADEAASEETPAPPAETEEQTNPEELKEA
ncbi:MAG: hypothetical protein EOO05_08685 [Chitinophagaceae bacterium]|nr:MAG: hypothetical protein EOO05_08685 [Chitinophagaceae bacterium]